jgi:alkylation response protein AidB-like acyl-CoA dehydrogenase
MDMKTPGIAINPLEYMDGKHYYNEVFFDDVHIPVGNIVGKEGKGWEVTQALSGFERSGVDTITSMQRMLENLVEYCNETKVGGRLLAQDPVIRNRLAEAACEIEAGRTLAYHIADLQNRGEMALFDASSIKVFSGELFERLAALGIDILGPYGQVKTSKWAPSYGFWEAAFQTTFVLTISMGTNEIQKNIIAWYGLGMPRPLSPVSIQKAIAKAQASK